MNTKAFIKNYLADFARITIVYISGETDEIWYVGDAISLRPSLIAGTVVTGVSLGENESDGIVIRIKYHDEED